MRHYYNVWSTAMDGGGCSLCAKLEGVAVRWGDKFTIADRSVKEPPLHDHCRCAVLHVHEDDLEPQSIRAYKAFSDFARIADSSVIFDHAVSGYFAAVYFLGQLAATPREILAAEAPSLAPVDFAAHLREVKGRRDDIFNSALKRAYDREWKEAQSLKTERGRAARLDLFVSCAVASQALSEANYQYLHSLRSGG